LNEINQFPVFNGTGNTKTTWYAQDVQRRAIGKSCGGNQSKAAITHHRINGFCQNMNFCVGKAVQNLQWSGQVELGDVIKNNKTNMVRHGASLS